MGHDSGNCCNCVRWKENLEECQLVREQGFTFCEFWPENNLTEKKKCEPAWLNQALNEGDGVYRP